ncbi:hypothetical protein BT93_H1501 [Corymbia citriodora subsp. variegata]|nr:hypothetical protein BT93_H1501 [Corymbia citriodora subsp. variegata]
MIHLAYVFRRYTTKVKKDKQQKISLSPSQKIIREFKMYEMNKYGKLLVSPNSWTSSMADISQTQWPIGCYLCKGDPFGQHFECYPPRGWSRWLQALPRALVAGFVKTDIEFQQRVKTSGTTVTLMVIDRWTIIVASVEDSRCILCTQGVVVCLLTVDHQLEENAEERE